MRFIVLLSLLFVGLTAEANVYAPKNSSSGIKQDFQGGLVVWNKGRQELVLKVELNQASATEKDLAWIIPLPCAPDRYEELDLNALGSVCQLWMMEAFDAREPAFDEDGFPVGPTPTKLESRFRVSSSLGSGSFTLQVIKTAKSGDGAALNNWLTLNGFGKLAVEDLKPYLNRGGVWLAVRSKSALGNPIQQLQALHISFACEAPVYPLCLSARQGPLDLALWVVTDRLPAGFEDSLVVPSVEGVSAFSGTRLKRGAEANSLLASKGWSAQGFWAVPSGELKLFLDRCVTRGTLPDFDEVYLHVLKIEARGIQPSLLPKLLPEDLRVEVSEERGGLDRLVATRRGIQLVFVAVTLISILITALVIRLFWRAAKPPQAGKLSSNQNHSYYSDS